MAKSKDDTGGGKIVETDRERSLGGRTQRKSSKALEGVPRKSRGARVSTASPRKEIRR